MPTSKERMTTTVDRELVRAGREAVAAGRAASLSGWVNVALAERAAKDRRLQAMAQALAAYEAERGEISAAELAQQERADRQSAVVVRGRKRVATPESRRRRAR